MAPYPLPSQELQDLAREVDQAMWRLQERYAALDPTDAAYSHARHTEVIGALQGYMETLAVAGFRRWQRSRSVTGAPPPSDSSEPGSS